MKNILLKALVIIGLTLSTASDGMAMNAVKRKMALLKKNRLNLMGITIATTLIVGFVMPCYKKTKFCSKNIVKRFVWYTAFGGVSGFTLFHWTRKGKALDFMNQWKRSLKDVKNINPKILSFAHDNHIKFKENKYDNFDTFIEEVDNFDGKNYSRQYVAQLLIDAHIRLSQAKLDSLAIKTIFIEHAGAEMQKAVEESLEKLNAQIMDVDFVFSFLMLIDPIIKMQMEAEENERINLYEQEEEQKFSDLGKC